jgi:mono/diheme cytochrome c family protein
MPRMFMLMFVLICVGALVVACAPNPSPAGLTPVPTLAPAATLKPAQAPAVTAPAAAAPAAAGGDAAQGAIVFGQKCAGCHGDQGQGGVGPALKNSKFVQGGDQPVIDTILNGRPGTAMSAWKGRITDADLANLLAHLKSWQK